MVVKKTKDKVCKLTKSQDKAWTNSFSRHKNNRDSDSVADRKAFSNLKRQFPSLKKCNKIR